MILYLNTSEFNTVHLGLIDTAGKKPARETRNELQYRESHKTLGFIKKFLAKNKCKPQDLMKIVVCSGPGSFTGIRVGVALAQALALATGTPVIAVKKTQVPQDLQKLATLRGGKSLVLDYGQEPNITKATTRR
jgi:tRNA threonylcarbamoyl adenosine modification protein YeaZ